MLFLLPMFSLFCGVSSYGFKGAKRERDHPCSYSATNYVSAASPSDIWKKSRTGTLSYKFVSMTSDMSVTRQRAAIERALFKWSYVTSLQFELTVGKADIEFLFYAYSRPGSSSFNGPGGIAANSEFYSINPGQMTARVNFDDSETWVSEIVPREWRCHHGNNDGGCCTEANPCTDGDGDCDNDRDCVGNLKCGKNNCDKMSLYDSSDDCCTQPNYNRRCSGKDGGCCTSSTPCKENEGDCDYGKDSDQCHGKLSCGSNNCEGEGFDIFDDCCYEAKGDWYHPAKLELAALHEIGHVLGLAHSDENDSVMNRQYKLHTGKFELSANDTVNIQKIWGDDVCRITHEQACSNIESDGLRIYTHSDGKYERFDCAELCKRNTDCGGFQLGSAARTSGQCVLLRKGCRVTSTSKAYDWNYFDIDTCGCSIHGTFVKKWNGGCDDQNLAIAPTIKGNVQQCINYCRKDTNCFAFEYKKSTQECTKYKQGRCQPTEENGFEFYMLHECPVNGGWGDWGTWMPCTRGITRRRRSCNSPVPSRGGNECLGDPFQQKTCSTTTD